MPVLLNLVEIKACSLIMPLLINGDVPALLRLYFAFVYGDICTLVK